MLEHFIPQLSLPCLAFLRTAYGALLLLTLISALSRRQFFLSDRWGGYCQSTAITDFIQSPTGLAIISFTWLGCAIGLILGWHILICAFINLVFSRYFFISQRWKSISRGMGAPGYMTYWLGLAVLLLEYSHTFAPALFGFVLLVTQIDLGLIMLSSATYKLFAGYARNHGMQFGMANPEWGYWAMFYARMSPNHWFFKTLNQLGWSTQMLGAVLMLFPQTRFWGALVTISSFIFVATQIRLELLCEIVIVSCLIYFSVGSLGDNLISNFVHVTPSQPIQIASSQLATVNGALAIVLSLYLCLVPLVHACLYYNLFARRRLPSLLQTALEKYANFFGIIIWRVFSADLTDFYITVYERPRNTDHERTLISRYGWPGSHRFNYVCEAITLTSLFTTRKYHPSNLALFHEKLLRYAKTLPHTGNSLLEFEYVSIGKNEDYFEWVPAVRYTVDLVSSEIKETILDDSISVSAPHEHSPIVEGAKPGSYAPLVR